MIASTPERTSFIGLIAIGQTLVILIGQIDLSVPWNLTLSAIVATNVFGRKLCETRDVQDCEKTLAFHA